MSPSDRHIGPARLSRRAAWICQPKEVLARAADCNYVRVVFPDVPSTVGLADLEIARFRWAITVHQQIQAVAA
jgi:hypothetical protein